jgi:hypothetical protein
MCARLFIRLLQDAPADEFTGIASEVKGSLVPWSTLYDWFRSEVPELRLVPLDEWKEAANGRSGSLFQRLSLVLDDFSDEQVLKHAHANMRGHSRSTRTCTHSCPRHAAPHVPCAQVLEGKRLAGGDGVDVTRQGVSLSVGAEWGRQLAATIRDTLAEEARTLAATRGGLCRSRQRRRAEDDARPAGPRRAARRRGS